jgi:hypothetical protein
MNTLCIEAHPASATRPFLERLLSELR